MPRNRSEKADPLLTSWLAALREYIAAKVEDGASPRTGAGPLSFSSRRTRNAFAALEGQRKVLESDHAYRASLTGASSWQDIADNVQEELDAKKSK